MMRFGFSHHPDEHHTRHVDLVRFAEERGFDQAWLPDQTFHRDPYVVLAACAAATERIRLGLAVINPFTRHPVVTARVAGTVAETAPGRFHLGIGAGNRRELLGPLGLDASDPAGRSLEMARIVAGLLRGEEVTLDGRYFHVSGVRLEFETPHRVPLHIAGRGRRMLRAAGEVADGAILGGLCTPLGIDYARRELERGAARSGRDLGELELTSWVTCTITDDRDAVLPRVRPMVAHIIGGAPADMLVEVGLPEDTIAAVKDEYARTGKEGSAELVTDACVDTFTVIGDADHVLERIEELERAGVSQFGLLSPPGTVDDHRAALGRFAEAVIEPYRARAAR